MAHSLSLSSLNPTCPHCHRGSPIGQKNLISHTQIFASGRLGPPSLTPAILCSHCHRPYLHVRGRSVALLPTDPQSLEAKPLAFAPHAQD